MSVLNKHNEFLRLLGFNSTHRPYLTKTNMMYSFQLLILQTIVAVILSIIIYHFIVLPKKTIPREGLNFSSSLIGFGVILPFILYEPIWIDDFLGLENTCFKMVVLALPSTLSLRCLEGT